jgi:hypothetical protein
MGKEKCMVLGVVNAVSGNVDEGKQMWSWKSVVSLMCC